MERLRAHYLVERELADHLRAAPKDARRVLYATLYDEMYRRVPDHPQFTEGGSPEASERSVRWQLGLLGRFLTPETVFLEIGPGDCGLSFAVAQRVRRVFAVDVSAEITRRAGAPPNFELALSDGCRIPLPDGSVTLAYSHQLMEHLHPDDALEQLREVYRVLAPGGRYVCVTPNRLGGPWDVSRYFGRVATGFHLKEYTVAELGSLFRGVGFRALRLWVGTWKLYLPAPVALGKACERALGVLPPRAANALARNLPLRLLLGVRLVGVK